MSQVDKIKVGTTTYNIAASADATNTFTSGDAATVNAKSWTDVNPMTTGETNKSILNKVSTMFKNARYLYNTLGTSVTPDNTVSSQLAGKAPSTHSHSISQIPHSKTQINSDEYIPTSSLVYSMNETIKSLKNAMKKEIPVPTMKEKLTYTGSSQSPVWNNYYPAKMTIGGTTSGTDVGTYTATFTLDPDSLYMWADGTYDTVSVEWTIDKAPGKVTCNPSSVILDPQHKSATSTITRLGGGALSVVSNWDGAKASVSGNTVTISTIGDANGNGVVTVTAAQSKNYNTAYGSINVQGKFIEVDPSDPNTRYQPAKLIATFNSISDVDTFFTNPQHTSQYKYTGLALGQEIQINNDGYNTRWIIAGFDCEKDHIASDGTPTNNGSGIFLIPKTYIDKRVWNSSYTTSGGYIKSEIHQYCAGTVTNNLKKTLGGHLINRNVLLSSAVNGNSASAYQWTTACAVLMSAGQVMGTFESNNNKFDDGEANYQIPVFKHMKAGLGGDGSNSWWLRGIYLSDGPWAVHPNNNGTLSAIFRSTSYVYGVRPLIMIR